MKIVQERSRCIGCGSCAAVCQRFFEMGEDGLANLKNAKEASGEDFELETEDADCAKEAAEICLVQIIKVEK